MKRLFWIFPAGAVFLAVLAAQNIDLGTITAGQKRTIAIPVFKGVGEAQSFMGAFNETLNADIGGSGIVKIGSRSFYPAFTPQQPSDFTTPPPVIQSPRGKKGEMTMPTNGGGHWMSDWSGPPTSANYVAIGYTAPVNGVLVLYGWLFDLSSGNVTQGKVLEKRYNGSVDEAGARKVAHEFAADIMALFGGQSLFGTHIYFDSNRTGHQEIWMMDYDGKNQRQVTHFNSDSIEPSVSADGMRIAFTSFAHQAPGIFLFQVDPPRDLRFYNQSASVNSSPSFTPDGKQIVYSSSSGRCCRIFIANIDGTGFKPITSAGSLDTEPKVNPKTGNDIVFSSGRSGPEQIYRMNMDGGDMERLSEGTGEAANPSWHPGGQIIAFAWTRGYSAGAWNIFVMDVASRQYNQLTHGEGKNEHPSWAPDGKHIVFASTRNGKYQIYTMLADGSQPAQVLTTAGSNQRPVWGK